MYELTIKGEVYQFNFGMGFLREVNKRYQQNVEGMDIKENIGLQVMVAGIYTKDVEHLVNVLEAANKGQNPRITKAAIDNYIDEECEDIDVLFDEVLDFLRKTNATKNAANRIVEAMETAQKQQK